MIYDCQVFQQQKMSNLKTFPEPKLMKKVSLKIRDGFQCGGHGLKNVQVKTEGFTCQLKGRGSFKRGVTHVWAGAELGNCAGKKFNGQKTLKFKMEAVRGSSPAFCPFEMTFKIGDRTYALRENEIRKTLGIEKGGNIWHSTSHDEKFYKLDL